jgi:hypothetical protein
MTGQIVGDAGEVGKAGVNETIRYTVTITNGGPDPATNLKLEDSIDPNTTLVGGSIKVSPLAANESYTSVGNMTLNSGLIGTPGTCANASDKTSVLCNDTLNANNTTTTITKFASTSAGLGAGQTPNGTNTITTANNGTVKLNANGTFTYDPAAGYEGTDEFWYRLENEAGNDAAKVSITVGGVNGMVWFVNTSGSVGGNNGTQAKPFLLLSDFQNVNNTGVRPGAANNDSIFLYESGVGYVGPLTMRSGQKLIGQDTTTSLSTLGAPAAQPGNAYPPVNNPSGANVSITSLSTGILLNSGNTLSGFTLGGGAANSALQGTNFGTLSVSGVNISSSGQAISLTTGALQAPGGGTAAFGTISSSAGTNGILLSSVTGSMATTGGTLTGTATGATFSVVGGSVSVTFSGGITQAANNAAVSVTGGHNGTIIFQTGTISATAGTGLQFSNADGSYQFNGTTTLGGGDAGVDILTDSAGTFTFASTTTITSPSGTAFNVDGGVSTSTANVTYSGNITQASNAAMVSVTNHNTGTITFQTGTLNATNGTGLQFSNADSASSYSFNGTTTLNGGDAGIDIISGSDGTFTFGAATSITRGLNVAGEAFRLLSSNSNVTYSGSMALNTSTGNLISIDNHDSGTITFQTGNLTKGSSTTQGISIQNCNGGTVNINNPTVTIAMTSGNAVSLTNNSGATISFNPAGGGNGIDLTTTSGIGFNATGGGTVTVAGTSNTIASTTGIALNVTSTEIGSAGLNFVSIAANGASSGIVLTSTGTAAGNGGLTVTGTATGSDRCGGTITNTNTPGTAATVNAAIPAECTGGTIQSTTSHGIILSSTKSPSLSRMRILNPAGDGINILTVNGFTLTNSLITDSAGVAQDRGIEMGDFSTGTPVNGTVTITNSTLGPTPHDNFGVGIASGTSTWNITGTLFDDSQLNSGFNFEIRNATVSNFTMSGNVLRNQFADGMQMQPASNVTTATITTSTIQNNTFVGNNLGMDLNHDGVANITYRVLNNTFLTHQAQAINFFSSAVQAPTTGGTLNGRFEGNVIGASGSTASGSAAGNGIRVNINGGADATVVLHNNTIRETPRARGIEVISRNGTGGLDVTVTNNTVLHTNLTYCGPGESSPCDASAPLAAIFIQSNCVGVCNSLRADVRGNTVPSGATSDILSTYIAVAETSGLPSPAGSISTAQLVDNAPTPSASGTAELTESHTNPAHNNTGSAAAESDVSLISGPINTVAMNMLQTNQQQQYYALNNSSDNSNNSLLAFLNSNRDFSSISEVVKPGLEASGNAATSADARVIEAGAALSSNVTGTELSSVSTRTEIEKGAAVSLAHARRSPTLTSRLSGFFSTVAGAVTPSAHAAPAPMPALEVNQSLGTLPANKSVVVVFDVTVNGPHPFASYTNNATIKADGVPDTQKQVVTPGDRYNNTTTLSADPASPAFTGDTVTFTATVTPSEAVGVVNPALGGFVQFKDNGVAIGAPIPCTADGNNCIAVLPTSSLTAGMHPITAEYLGGTHHELSNSSALNYTISACTNNPVVTTINDGTAPVPAGSLREALANVCPNSPNNTITFATGAGQAFDPATGPHVIQLAAALPAITKNIIIQGPGANMLEVRGSQAGAGFRVFSIGSAAANVNISGMTISGGGDALGGGGVNNAGTLTLSDCAVGTSTNTNITTGAGGGIFNSGTLTIDRCTISNNVATVNGGGISNAPLATLTVKNSTISTNTSNGGANTGGGVNNAGTATFTNVTVAANLLGGGIVNANATPTSFTIGNSIVADSAGGSDDLTGVFNSAGYNLFENAGTATIGGTTTGNQTGVDPKLGALFNNGGPTLTHALLSGSTAIDAGDNTLATNAGLTTTDQRGTGFPRKMDGADANAAQTVDIGAFELHPSVEDITDKTFPEDTSLEVTFNIGDATGAGSPLITSVAATSSNAALVPNGNLVISAVAGSDTQRKLTITPVANANSATNGTATITVTVTATNGQTATDTFVVTVSSVNDGPLANNDPNYITDEDVALTVNTASGVLANDTDSDSPGMTAVIVTNPSHAQSFTLNSDGSFNYTPVSNFNGTDTFTYKANDGTDDSSAATVTITVNAVSDPVGTVASGAISVAEDSTNNGGANMSITDVDAAIAPNGVYEVSLSSTHGTMSMTTIAGLTFTVGDGTADAAMTFHGTLASINTALATATYTPDANYSGSAQIKLEATDTFGGIVATGTGLATADSNIINVTVTAENDAPTLTNNGLTVNEGSTGNTISSAELALSDPDNPAATTLVFQLASVPANGTLKKSGTALGLNDTFTQDDVANNRITYDHNGSETTSDSFNFTATDGTNNIGSTAFSITVTPQNDVPAIGTNAGLTVVPGTTGTIDSTKLSVTDADNAATSLVYTVGTAPVNGALKNNGTQLNAGGTFTQDDINNNLITYTHNGNAALTDSFTFTVSDGAGGSIGSTTFNININCSASTVVTTTADAGAGSLREAIQTACAGNTITFNLDSNTDPGYDSVTDTFTIKLTTGELLINRNLTITGPTNQRVVISGNNTDPNPANRSRVFNVASGTVTISNLTIANGESQFGGGIYNLGNLTLNNVTLTGNKAVTILGVGGDGGAIDSNGGTLTINNSTISGNTADGGGGGLHHCGNSTGVLNNVTVAGNRSDADNASPGEGGGIEQVSSNTITLNNTIVAGNLKGTGGSESANDLDGTFQSENSLIQTPGSATLTGTGNITGQDPQLDVLAFNGGPTQTRRLLPGSQAVNNGKDSLTSATFDQRGTGFNRKVGTVDIGAYEVQAGVADRLAFNVQPSNTNAGVAIAPAVTVRILDVLNNLTTSTANVTVAIGTNPSAGTLSGTTTVAAVNGTATFSDLSINNIGAGYTLTASSTGLAGATSNAFNIISASIVSGTKTVSGTKSIGQTITYTITLTNSSPGVQLDNAGNEFTDVLPAGLTLVSASATSGTAVATVATNTVTWNGALAGNGFVTITIQATINAGTSGQTLSNQGSISYDADGNGTNEAAAVTDDPGVAGANNPTSFIVNATPTITQVGVTRNAGDAVSSSTIANVNDLEDAENTLAVTVNNGATATVNGVTVSGLSVSAAGVVTANVVAACGATNASFTLKVADSGGLSSTDTLSVTVNANTAPVLIYSTQAVDTGASLNITPATGPTDTNLSSITVLSTGTYTGGISVNNTTGVVAISNAAPLGSHTITIRATDSCGVNTDAQFTLNVNKHNQTITFNPLANKTFGDADFTVSATASSNLAVTFSATGNCTVTGNSVHITGAGSCTVTASQAGDQTYNAATPVQQSFTINKANTTTTVTVANAVFDGQPHGGTANVTGAGGLNQNPAVTYTGRNATVYGPSTTAPTNAGEYTASASFAANADYNGSSDSKDFQIGKASQTITFSPLTDKTFGDADFTVSATASSNLAVTFSATGNCTVTGNSVHITGAGSCSVTASQAGNNNFNAAVDVQRSFNIAKQATTTSVSSSANPSIPGQSVTFTATLNWSSGILTGAVQFKDGGVDLGAPVNLTLSGVATFSTNALSGGNHNITAVYSGDANFQTSTGTLAGGQNVGITTGLSINDVTVTEGNSGTINAVFTVTLSQASNVAVTVDYATANGTATTADNDYQSANGTLTFSVGETTKTVTVTVNGDTKNEPNETFSVNLTNAQNANIGDNQGQGTITNDDTPTVQLSNSTYTINEGANNTPQGFTSLAVDIVRSGDASNPATVKYITSDASGGNECNQVTGQASQRCDYILVGATLRFAAGETTKTIQIPIINDGYQEGAEFFSIELTNGVGVTIGSPSQAIVTIQDDAADATPTTSANNPYLSNTFFVRQNYLDLLGRDADQNGFTDWTNVLNNCGPQKGFIGAPFNCDRAHVAHGFFGSVELTNSGFLIHRLFEVGLGRLPFYREFIPDMATLSGFNLSQAQQQQNLEDYLQQFTARPEFQSRYQGYLLPSQAAQFIQLMEQVAGKTLPATATTLPGQPQQYGRQELINLRANGTLNVGQTLKAFVEQKDIYDTYFERGEVTMLYFSYLRRDPNLNDPNLIGWNDWVDVFTNGKPSAGIPPRDIHHLIFGFIYSEEYRKRFGQP